jgi:DNA topoisomerase-1
MTQPARHRTADGSESPTPETVQSAVDVGLRYVQDDGPGISRQRKGRGFAYFDPDGKTIRDRKTIARIAALVIPPAWQRVWISPRENTHIQAVGRDAKGRKQYRYHARYRAARDLTKFDRLADFGAILPGIRRQVGKDLSSPGLTKRNVLAAVVSLLDQTCIRVGNEEYARSNHSYGLTTLRDKHATICGGTIRLHFRGKSGCTHDVELSDPKVARIVKRSQDLPGQELFQYRTETGDFAPLNSADVNDYLREISDAEITAKDFRTWHGTQYALAELKGAGPAANDTEAKRNITAAVQATALKLGNRPAACRAYYIHPAVFDHYRDGTLFRILSRDKSRSPEASVLNLVNARPGR